jgi:uncharacterized protein (TIGR02996 family)
MLAARRVMEGMEGAFRRDVCEHPDDDTSRLVYADWLDERGNPGDTERAEFIRAQCAAARLPQGDPRRRALETRANQLLPAQEQRWQQELREVGVELRSLSFERGFPTYIYFDLAGQFLAHAQELFAEAPIRSLHVAGGPPEEIAAMVVSPYMARLEELDLSGKAHGDPLPISEAGLEALAASPHFAHLRKLALGHAGIGSEGARALATSRNLPGLQELDLRFNSLGSTGAALLASSPHLRQLCVLNLSNNGIGSDGARAVAAAPWLDGLQELEMGGNWLGDEGAQALAASPHVTHLRELGLSGSRIGDIGARALAYSPHLLALEGLELDNNRISTQGARAFMTTLDLPCLQRVELHHNLYNLEEIDIDTLLEMDQRLARRAAGRPGQHQR